MAEELQNLIKAAEEVVRQVQRTRAFLLDTERDVLPRNSMVRLELALEGYRKYQEENMPEIEKGEVD